MKYSPLDSAHRELGAKMVPFGGWEMPIQYPSGTLAEHRACRDSAVVFDVSHLGSVRLTGADSFDHLQRTLTNDLNKISPGRAQYTHLLDEEDGSIVDDIIVWWLDETTFDIIPNASNTDQVIQALDSNAVDITHDRALLALQGPQARQLLAKIAPEAAEIGRFRVGPFSWGGVECLVAGTGYTGEDGVEVSIPREQARQFWDAVLEVGFQPSGLASRDTLRLEAGFPLYGNELGPGITPLHAGLGWVVGWDKGPFRGREALEQVRAQGTGKRLQGFSVSGRRPPRVGQKVLIDDRVVGEVTSGNFSPVLSSGIGMAYLDLDVEVGAEVTIDMRGTPVEAKIVSMPFVETA